MAKTFNLPAVGDTMQEGEIVEWFVAVGDEVKLDQTICSLETDKSVVEMTTPYRGTVLFLAASPGEVVTVGSPLIVVGEAGEEFSVPTSGETPSAAPTPAAPPAAAPVAPAVNAAPTAAAAGNHTPLVLSPVVRRMVNDYGIDLTGVTGSGPGGRILRTDVEAARAAQQSASNRESTVSSASANGSILAMPKVRKLARERSIDLSRVTGTGPRHSITIADLATPSRVVGTGTERRVRLSAMRRSIAAHLTESAREIPQFTSMVDVDASALIATRKALGERAGSPIPIDALLIALMVPVLTDHPIMTAALDGDEIVYHDRHDIGIAVDTQDGLMVPVIHGADAMTVSELGAAVTRLATAARDRSIAPGELAGATCTLNNIGALGLLAGTPILPLGTSMILATGRTRPIVELRDGAPVAVPTMTLSATFDHRLIDGGDSARFLTQLKRHLEVPALGLL